MIDHSVVRGSSPKRIEDENAYDYAYENGRIEGAIGDEAYACDDETTDDDGSIADVDDSISSLEFD